MRKRVAWNEFQPIAILPKRIQGYFVKDACFLRDDLLENKLKVILVPAPEERHTNHMIRVAETANPSWYSKLYAQNFYFRRDRSLRALERIAAGKDEAFTNENCGAVDYRYNYDSIYRQLIFSRLTTGFSYRGQETNANIIVCNYFGLIPPDLEDVPF